jgi:hypothetical protein
MGTNCVTLLPADLFFNLFEADIIHVSLEKNEKKLVLAFNFTFRYKDDVPSLRSSKFGDFDDRLYSVELARRIIQIQVGLLHTLEFQPKRKNWIYHHSTGFLNCTSVLSNSVTCILLGLPNAPRNLFPNY